MKDRRYTFAIQLSEIFHALMKTGAWNTMTLEASNFQLKDGRGTKGLLNSPLVTCGASAMTRHRLTLVDSGKPMFMSLYYETFDGDGDLLTSELLLDMKGQQQAAIIQELLLRTLKASGIHISTM